MYVCETCDIAYENSWRILRALSCVKITAKGSFEVTLIVLFQSVYDLINYLHKKAFVKSMNMNLYSRYLSIYVEKSPV